LFFFRSPVPGWIVSILAAAFCLHIFLFVDGRSHSASDTLYGVFPYWVPDVPAMDMDCGPNEFRSRTAGFKLSGCG
jgi:hypothetical protein